MFFCSIAFAKVKVTDIDKQIVCQCGCNLVLATCNHTECSSKAELYTLINEKIKAGLNQEQIIKFFMDKYGEKILSAPTKKGFNLIAWILPFLGLLAGLVLVILILQKYVVKTVEKKIAAETKTDLQTTDPYLAKVEKELEEL